MCYPLRKGQNDPKDEPVTSSSLVTKNRATSWNPEAKAITQGQWNKNRYIATIYEVFGRNNKYKRYFYSEYWVPLDISFLKKHTFCLFIMQILPPLADGECLFFKAQHLISIRLTL